MGSGSYSVTDSSISRSALGYHEKSNEEIFTQRKTHDKMSPKGLTFREARDSEEHPKSLPIVLALDLTGSMGNIPQLLVRDGLPKIMGNILQNGIKDPQVLFLGIGDHECDGSPLQIGQFESSDELMDKWLTNVYIESGGGGNSGESYMLAWYAAARYTKIDSFEKRGEKGLLFTIGDEPVLKSLPASAQEEIMGNGRYVDLTTEEILKEVSEKYDIYHILVKETYAGGSKETQRCWKQLLKDHCIEVERHEEIPAVIARIIAESQGHKDVKISDSVEELIEKEKEEML